jgi:hypothetical protein
MKHVTRVFFVSFLVALPLFADDALRPFPNATGGYSIYFPVVTRVQGASTFFYTSLDLTNNHSTQSTDVNFNYISADGTINKSGKLVTLQKLGSYHSDDFIKTLADSGVITQTQAASTFGTLYLTFTNTAFTTGTEGSAVARVYNFVTGNSGPSIGLAFRAQPLHTNGAHKLVSVISDTDTPGNTGVRVITNLGLMNVGINDAGDTVTDPATLTLTFIDPATGFRVGTQPQVTLNRGQVTQLNDVFSSFSIPATATSLTVLVEGPTGASAPQIDGYVVLKDVLTNDGSYFPMQTASAVTTAPNPAPPPGVTASRLYVSPLFDFKLHTSPSPRTSALEWCVSSTDFPITLGGDIPGSSYTINLGVKTAATSSGDGSLRADIILKRGSTETVLASTTFSTTPSYVEKDATISGVDPAAQDGDTLLLRVTRVSGNPCIAEFISNGVVNHIDIPATPVRP